MVGPANAAITPIASVKAVSRRFIDPSPSQSARVPGARAPDDRPCLDGRIDRRERDLEVMRELPPGGLALPHLDDPEALVGRACDVQEQAPGRPPEGAG